MRSKIVFACLLASITPVLAQQAAQPLPGGQTGILTVTIKNVGLVMTSNSKNERQDWMIRRSAEFRTSLKSQMSSAFDMLGEAPVAPAMPKVTASQAQMMDQMQKAMRSCKEDDQNCMMEAAKRAAGNAPLPAAPQAAPSGAMDFTRYQSWNAQADNAPSCAVGTASLDETMDGNSLSDNSGAMWSIEGTRRGEAKLPQGSWSHSCDTTISFDRKAGTYTLRIGGLNLNIPSSLHLQRKGVASSAANSKLGFGLLEYADVPLVNDGIVLKKQKGDPASVAGAATFTGTALSEKRDGGYVVRVAPNVTTTITWKLTLQ